MRDFLKGVMALAIAPVLVSLLACDQQTEQDTAKPSLDNAQAQFPEVVLDDLGPPVRDDPLVGGPIEQEGMPVKAKAREQREPYDKLPKSEYEEIEWTDLIPPEDLEALSNPPSYITDVEEGSMEDEISDQMQNDEAIVRDDPYQRALKSDKIIPEMDGKNVRIPGFIVPLEFDEEQMIYQFFLVPFFGACIHVPPPPPNQVIFVDYPEGFRRRALFDPFWISGKLATSIVENDVATSAYTLQMHYIEPYTETAMEERDEE